MLDGLLNFAGSNLGKGLIGAGLGAVAGKQFGGDRGMLLGGLLGGGLGYGNQIGSALGLGQGGANSNAFAGMVYNPETMSYTNASGQGLLGGLDLGTSGQMLSGLGNAYSAYKGAGTAEDEMGLYRDSVMRERARQELMEGNMQTAFANSGLYKQPTIPTYY